MKYPNFPIVECSMCGERYNRKLKHGCISSIPLKSSSGNDLGDEFNKSPIIGRVTFGNNGAWQCPGCKLWHAPDIKSCDCEVGDLTEEEIKEFTKRISGENEVLKGEVGK